MYWVRSTIQILFILFFIKFGGCLGVYTTIVSEWPMATIPLRVLKYIKIIRPRAYGMARGYRPLRGLRNIWKFPNIMIFYDNSILWPGAKRHLGLRGDNQLCLLTRVKINIKFYSIDPVGVVAL